MRDVGDRDKQAEAVPLPDEADGIVEVPGILPVDRDERKIPLVDPRVRLVSMAHSAAAGGKTDRLRDRRRLLEHGARKRDGEIHRGGHGKEESLHRVRLPESADYAGPSLLLTFGIFGDLRKDKFPGFRRKIRRKVRLEEQVGLPIAESDEGAVSRRRGAADKRRDTPLQ